MYRDVFPALLILAAAGALAGCYKADVTIPEIPDVNFGGQSVFSPPPTDQIPPANRESPTDLRRENEQLRARAGWVEEENRELAEKYHKLGQKMDEIKTETEALQAQAQRYRQTLED